MIHWLPHGYMWSGVSCPQLSQEQLLVCIFAPPSSLQQSMQPVVPSLDLGACLICQLSMLKLWTCHVKHVDTQHDVLPHQELPNHKCLGEANANSA